MIERQYNVFSRTIKVSLAGQTVKIKCFITRTDGNRMWYEARVCLFKTDKFGWQYEEYGGLIDKKIIQSKRDDTIFRAGMWFQKLLSEILEPTDAGSRAGA